MFITLTAFLFHVSAFIYQCNYRAAKKFCWNPLFLPLSIAFSFSNWHYFYIPWLPINSSKRKSLFENQSLSLVLLRIWFISGSRTLIFYQKLPENCGVVARKSPRNEWVKLGHFKNDLRQTVILKLWITDINQTILNFTILIQPIFMLFRFNCHSFRCKKWSYLLLSFHKWNKNKRTMSTNEAWIDQQSNICRKSKLKSSLSWNCMERLTQKLLVCM